MELYVMSNGVKFYFGNDELRGYLDILPYSDIPDLNDLSLLFAHLVNAGWVPPLSNVTL